MESQIQNIFLGKKYVNNKLEEINVDYLSKISLIGLFFTGSWCRPCEKFSQELIQVYNDANTKEKIIEIIQISNEKNEKDFIEGISTKPWISIQYNDNFNDALVNEYKVNYLPLLIIMTKDKIIISETSRKDIVESGIKAHEKWMKTYKLQKDKERDYSNSSL